MTVHANVPTKPGVPEEDLCVILGNILENAFNASTPVPQNQRRITVAMICQEGTVCIEVKNTFKGELVPDGKSFYSSKEKGRHGIGLSSVRSMAEKYSGDVWLNTEPGENGVNVFSIQVLLFSQS